MVLIMKNYLYLLFFVTSIAFCQKNFKHPRYTNNDLNPVVYINGYKDYSIIPVLSIQDNDSIYINELRFNQVDGAMYIGKFMYDKFGKWSKFVKTKNENIAILVWEKVKLFKDSNQLYDVATSGVENYIQIYTSVSVYKSELNKDCFDDDILEKEKIIKYFSIGIINLSSNNQFYKEYWKTLGIEKD
jgi:hypothetical protein